MKQLGLGLGEEQPRRPRAANLEHYHIRSHQTVAEALQGEAKAQAQDELVLSAFKPGDRLTPTAVELHLVDRHPQPTPYLTSIRRSLTNLTKAGRLVHHPADRRPGPRGARESTWSLA